MINKVFEKYSDEIKKAILIRTVEEKLLKLFREGKLNGTVHTCVGQEFSSIFISKYLTKNDHIVSNHRGHGHYLSRFNDIKGLIGEVMGKTIGCSGGFGGSQHIVNNNYISNGIQGGMVPIAAGIALYNKTSNRNGISIAYIGDGTLGEGIIYETFNIASKWNLPLLIVMENNLYAQSTSINQTFSGDLIKRVEGFGFEYFLTDTYDLVDLDQKSKEAISYVRNKSKPAFIEIDTYRLNAHSKGDDNRSIIEINDFRSKDFLTNILNTEGTNFNNYYEQTKNEIDNIVHELDKSENLTEIIDLDNNILNNININISPEIKTHARYNTLLNKALSSFLDNNKKALIIGEDIEDNNEFTPEKYGGAFKVTRELSINYPNRLINTPISEAAIVGISAGYSIKAGRTIVEIMFGDFTTLIFDQVLQHISKFETIYNKNIQCPLIIRTPMGGKRGYGPTHSQSLEKYFLGIPNLYVIALHHRISPDYLYNAICKANQSPFLVIENKILYTIDTSIKKIECYKYDFSDTLFPSLFIRPDFDEPILTIICYGEVLNEVELAVRELFIELEAFVEIVCPTLLSPIDVTSISESVIKTNNLIIIEEGCGEASWGSEVVSKLVEKNVTINKLIRFSNNNIIPSSFEAEKTILPTKENIFKLLSNIVSEL